MTFARLVLAGSALAFAGIALAFLADPAGTGRHVGLSLSGAIADNDVRAVYGGLQLGCTGLLAWCALDPERVRFGLVAQLLLFGGLAGARFVSLATAGSPGALGLALHGAELAGVAAGAVALRRLPDRA